MLKSENNRPKAHAHRRTHTFRHSHFCLSLESKVNIVCVSAADIVVFRCEYYADTTFGWSATASIRQNVCIVYALDKKNTLNRLRLGHNIFVLYPFHIFEHIHILLYKQREPSDMRQNDYNHVQQFVFVACLLMTFKCCHQ